jgi:hypothetical protein
MTLTIQDKNELLFNRKIIIDSEHFYTIEELNTLYTIHNRIYKTNKEVIKCASCINAVIVSLQKALSKVI